MFQAEWTDVVQKAIQLSNIDALIKLFYLGQQIEKNLQRDMKSKENGTKYFVGKKPEIHDFKSPEKTANEREVISILKNKSSKPKGLSIRFSTETKNEYNKFPTLSKQ